MRGVDLHVWVEPYYAKTPWYRELLMGLKSGLDAKRQKAHIAVIENPDRDLPSDATLILAGETNQWFFRMLEYTYKHNIHVCVASSDPESISSDISSVSLDRQKDMNTMVRYLFSAQRQHIALFGINPSSPADQKRCDGYLQTVKLLGLSLNESDIFYTYGDVSVCVKALLKKIGNYDAIISSNDLYAIYLLPHLFEKNISVPHDMFLASFGNRLLSRTSKPTITTSTLNHMEMGRQAIYSSLYMYSNPHVSNMAVTIDGNFYPRQSTNEIPFTVKKQSFIMMPECYNVSSFNDPNLKQIFKLEMCLAEGDSVNLAIIKWLISDKPFSELTEHLFLSDSAIDYRLSKLYHYFDVASRQELTAVFKKFTGYIDFSKII